MGRRLVLFVAAALVVGVPTASHASPGASCGDVITQDLTLTHDLIDCVGDGLVVGASGITIDLGGYTIDGDDDTTLNGGAGVRIAGFGSVTLLNGTITGFSQGVQLDFTTGNNVSRLHTVANVRGIDLANSWNNVIEKNTATGNDLDGIRVNGVVSDGNLVAQNLVTGNVFGVTVSDFADDNVITRNTVTGSVFGISVFVGADRTTVSRNHVAGNTSLGIQIQLASDDALVERNTVTGNGLGILVEPAVTGATVARNDAFDNTGDGIRFAGANGAIDRNDVFDNAGYGILLTSASSNNTARFNNASGNALGDIVDNGTGNVIVP